jgi:predicted RND superfamily exporter protein
MVQRGLPTPYNLKPKSKSPVLKKLHVTTKARKLLLYLVVLIVVGSVIYTAIPDKNVEIEVKLDDDLNQARLAKIRDAKLAGLADKASKAGAVATEGHTVNKKKLVTNLDKLKDDLKNAQKD